MRVSGLCFGRIRDRHGRYCLLLNTGRLKHNGERILSPVGGCLQAWPEGLVQLVYLGAFGFREEAQELQFYVADRYVEAIVQWFKQRTQRELSVWRELVEELTGETAVLSNDDYEGATERFARFVRYDAPTARTNVTEKLTAYLIEVFDVTLGPEAMHKLLAASQVPIADRWVYFVTAEEILQGRTNDGVAIGPISGTLMVQ